MIKLGIDQIDRYIDIFKDKRVGLMTNPTGMSSDFKSTINILHEKTQLISLFGPEHGVRGDLQAGVHFDHYVDEETHCKVYSVYGKHKAPTDDMLKDIDVFCFDIQDVGARFYTFIYSMAYAMMACAKHDIKFVVFDRPNPLGGLKVEGHILDIEFRSFVGYYPIVERYGLTIGELAQLFNKEFNINCDLEVIPMQGWKRNMLFKDLNIPWVLPSPNMPTAQSTFAYLATCYFEGTNLSEGRGTTKPFEIIGAPWFKADQVMLALSKLNLKGIKFRKIFFTPTFSKHKDQLCEGIELLITNEEQFEPVKLGMYLLDIIKRIHPEFEILKPYIEGRKRMLEFLLGASFFTDTPKPIESIIDQLEKDSLAFKQMKGKYHIYETL
jgi:uncharacterized protein YbbC (DUF1343 family)